LSCSKREDRERRTGYTDSDGFQCLPEGISGIEESGADGEDKEKQFHHSTDFYTAQMLSVKRRHGKKTRI
jgi:hypothetical protein